MRSKLVIRLFAAVIGATATAAIQAVQDSQTEAASERGFSYFVGVGRQQASYSEKARIVPVESSAVATSPILLSGALYAVSDNVLFSVNNETTFYPNDTTERWNSTAPVFNGAVLTNRLLQSNAFSLSQSNTDILAHYRIGGPVFGIAGPTIRTLTFTRSAFQIGPDNAVALPAAQTIEERSGEIIINVGIALESERVTAASDHYGLRVTAGLPTWRRVRNTSVPNVEFSSAKGLDFGVEGRYSRALTRGIHLGLWGKWSVSERDAETVGSNELPHSRLENRSIGLELLWKL